MKIPGMSQVAGIAHSQSIRSDAAPKLSFKDVAKEIAKSRDLHQELVSLQEGILSGRKFTPQELLLYQIKASEFGMEVEMISKLGETLTSTLRRFEQNH